MSTGPAKKTFFIESVGCAENIIDGAILKNIAVLHGLERIKDPSKADLIVFNTCAFKQKQEDLCVEKIKKYQQIKKKDAEVIVCGCLTEINTEKLKSVFDGVHFSPRNLDRFYGLIDPNHPQKVEEVHHILREDAESQMFGVRSYIEKIYDLKRFFKNRFHLNILPNFNIFDYIGDENTLYVRISRGCLNQCGYCAIRFAQGPLVSQPMEAIVRTIEKGVAEGYKKVFLIGTNTSHYGKDIGTDFFTLLEKVLKIQGDFKIIIHNFEPHGIEEAPERFLENVSSPKILSFYFPLNSGSQFILNRMRRGYDIESVMSTLRRLREKNRKVLIRSEFIVGYPGEKWKHFSQSLGQIMRFPFSRIDLHMYSPRPKIQALELDGQVPFFARYLRFIIIHCLVFFRVDLKKLRPI